MSTLVHLVAERVSGHTFSISSQFAGEDPVQEEHTFSLTSNQQATPYEREVGNPDHKDLTILVRKTTAPPPPLPSSNAVGGGDNNGDPVQVEYMECIHTQQSEYNIKFRFISENHFQISGTEYRQVALGSANQSMYCMVVYYNEDQDGTMEAQFEGINCHQGSAGEGVPLLLTQGSINEPFSGYKHALVWIQNS